MFIPEQITLLLSLTNPLQLPLSLSQVRLLWSFSPATEGGATVNNESGERSEVAATQSLASLTLESGASVQVALGVTPRQLGEFMFTAVAFELCGPIGSEAPISVPGES